MGITFDFSTSNRIIFGEDRIKEAPSIISQFGKRVLLVTGRSNADAQSTLSGRLTSIGVEVYHFSTTTEEPTIQVAESGAALAKGSNCQVVVGFGGGSSLDLAKAIAALATNPGAALDYLEVVGKGQPLENPPLPVIAIPTSAGTGTEVTRNAVLTDPTTKIKASLRHSMMIPRVAIVDPSLTVSMPKDVTAATGMDALTQLIEPYLSNGSNDLTDLLCTDGILRVGRSLRDAWANPTDIAAREDMSYAALLSGMALANSKLGAVHGFTGPVGAMFSAPHGVLCARFLAPVLAENLNASQQLGENQVFYTRLTTVSRLLTGDPAANPVDGNTWIESRCNEFGIPRLGSFGITHAHFPMIIAAARNASSMKGNPFVLSDAQMTTILEKVL